MNPYILVVLIMAICIVSVVGIRALYRLLNKNSSKTEGKKWDVEEFTSNLNK